MLTIARRSWFVPALLSVSAALSFSAALSGCSHDGSLTSDVVDEEVSPVGTFVSDAAGFDTRSFWIDTGAEVVVFDAQFTTKHAEQLLQAIRSATSSPIRFVVVTHPNPDKFNGVSVFQKLGAKVVASERTATAIPGVHAYKRAFFVDTAKMIPAAEYPAEATIDVTFSGKLRLPTEAGEIWLEELEHSGVSTTQTVGWVPASRSLFVGDLVHHGAHAWLEGGISGGAPRPDLTSWRSALDELRRFEGATVYGGRGEPAPVDLAVAEQKAYLERAETIVRDYVTGLGPQRAELGGPKAGTHHAAIRALFEKEWPARELSYLIEYGVYGLVGAIDAK